MIILGVWDLRLQLRLFNDVLIVVCHMASKTHFQTVILEQIIKPGSQSVRLEVVLFLPLYGHY